MKRVKYTYLVNGLTGLCDTKNILTSLGPDNDPHREVVVMRITYHPPIKLGSGTANDSAPVESSAL